MTDAYHDGGDSREWDSDPEGPDNRHDQLGQAASRTARNPPRHHPRPHRRRQRPCRASQQFRNRPSSVARKCMQGGSLGRGTLWPDSAPLPPQGLEVRSQRFPAELVQLVS